MIKRNKKAYKEVLKEIRKADTIVVFRHEIPDYDALGTQYGLVTWLKNSFPTKKILVTGKDHPVFTPRLYPSIEQISDEDFPKDFLAIVVDTANTKRVDDKRFLNAQKIIKFDHHPNVEPFGAINIVQDELSSCSELIYDFISYKKKKYPLSRVAAMYLFSGIAGDSGRFLFSSVTKSTFLVAGELMDTGLNISKDVYLKMYQKTHQDLLITRHVINSIVFTEGGVAYYVLKDEDVKRLNITPGQGKDNLSLMSNLEDIEVWMSITEDVEKNEWRLSIRSKEMPINEVATHFGGGGHANASGGKLKSLDEIPLLVNELEERIRVYRDKSKISIK